VLIGTFPVEANQALNLQVRLPIETQRKKDRKILLTGTFPVEANQALNLQVCLPAEI